MTHNGIHLTAGGYRWSASELVGRAKRLVDDRAKRKGCDVEVVTAVKPLAGVEGGGLDGLVVTRRRLEQRLLDCRCGSLGRRAERLGVDRHGAPAAHNDALGPAGFLDRAPTIRPAPEDHRDAESGLGQERGGQRHEDAGAVARTVIRRHGSPVPDTTQGLEEGVENCPRRATGESGDETDAAGIALADRRIERGETRHLHTFSIEGESPA